MHIHVIVCMCTCKVLDVRYALGKWIYHMQKLFPFGCMESLACRLLQTFHRTDHVSIYTNRKLNYNSNRRAVASPPTPHSKLLHLFYAFPSECVQLMEFQYPSNFLHTNHTNVQSVYWYVYTGTAPTYVRILYI